jgi:hypothetical protein
LASFSVPEASVTLLLVSMLDTGGQSNVAEQLGHDKRRGSQALYLKIYLIILIKVGIYFLSNLSEWSSNK